MNDLGGPQHNAAVGGDEGRIVELAGAMLSSHALHMAADLGIADLFGDEPHSANVIAAGMSVDQYTL